MKVLAIVGSPHINGNASFLVDQLLEEISSQGIETEKIILAEHVINPCQGHYDCSSFKECKLKDDAPGIIDKFNEADGVILATPVYFQDVTAQMKTFIDRNYFTFTHEKPKKIKYAGLIVVGGGHGADETITTLKHLVLLPEEQVFAVSGYLGKDSVKDHPEIVAQVREMGAKLAKALA